jgi:hypothetical protein
MIQPDASSNHLPQLPRPRPGALAPAAEETVIDRRPRLLRWLLPKACATSAPLDGMQQAELKFIAYH